jgi:hypothetical protein
MSDWQILFQAGMKLLSIWWWLILFAGIMVLVERRRERARDRE